MSLNIREDIYPDAVSLDKQKILEGWISVVFEAFERVFESKDNFIDYLTDLKIQDLQSFFLKLDGYIILLNSFTVHTA